MDFFEAHDIFCNKFNLLVFKWLILLFPLVMVAFAFNILDNIPSANEHLGWLRLYFAFFLIYYIWFLLNLIFRKKT